MEPNTSSQLITGSLKRNDNDTHNYYLNNNIFYFIFRNLHLCHWNSGIKCTQMKKSGHHFNSNIIFRVNKRLYLILKVSSSVSIFLPWPYGETCINISVHRRLLHDRHLTCFDDMLT